MQSNHHVTDYDSPVLRPPSPASSIGTTYPQDQTSFSDSDILTEAEFQRKWENKIGLGHPTKEEDAAEEPVLLGEWPVASSAEERALHDHVMRKLRRAVQDLEENELFEQTLLRGSRIALEEQPSTNDIDSIMRSMMPGSNATNANTAQAQYTSQNAHITDGPWNQTESRYEFGGGMETLSTGSGMMSAMLGGLTGGRRQSRGGSRRP